MKAATIQTVIWSLFSLRFPQCVSLRSGLKTRSRCRWIARSIPIWAKIIGPPCSAARVTKWAAALDLMVRFAVIFRSGIQFCLSGHALQFGSGAVSRRVASYLALTC